VIEGTRSLDVMKLCRSGYLSNFIVGSWQWTYGDGETSSIGVTGGRNTITLTYRIRVHSEDWQSVRQQVPIRWAPCRFGGERPWFVCDVQANGVYCGRRVAKLYSGGRLFACRHCYRLGYRVQRVSSMDQAHHLLTRLHRKLGADYDGPEMAYPPKPKWMRGATYERHIRAIEAAEQRLDAAFTIGAVKILARIEKSEQRKGIRR
jgi:hypothetical protein